MPETPTAAELEIPDAAEMAWIKASDEARREGHTGIAYAFGLRAAAPLIVAAELRRIAEYAGIKERTLCTNDMQLLIRRADELDPPAGQED